MARGSTENKMGTMGSDQKFSKMNSVAIVAEQPTKLDFRVFVVIERANTLQEAQEKTELLKTSILQHIEVLKWA